MSFIRSPGPTYKNMSFAHDKAKGKEAEKFVADQLRPTFGPLKMVGEETEYYDLISNDGLTIEVKLDEYSKRSPFIGIEYEYKGDPSGISKTTADYWCHIFYDDHWLLTWAPTSAVHNLAHNHCEKEVPAGDDAMLYLIRKSFYRRLSWVNIKAIVRG